MNILSFTATIVFTLSLAEGLYIILSDFRSVANRLFMLICLSIALWLMGALFGYSAPDRESVVFWFKFASPGFIFLHAFTLHFVCRYAGLFDNRFIFLIYLPSIAFQYIAFSDHLVFSDFYREGDSWILVPDYTCLSFYLFMASYLVYYLAALVILHLNARRSGSRRVRAQSRIMFYSILFTILSYNIEPFLVPLFFEGKTYGISPTFSIIWLSGICYAMARYSFLHISESYIGREILGALNDMVLVADLEKRVLLVNRSLSERLKIGVSPRRLDEIIVEKDILGRQAGVLAENDTAHILLNFRAAGEAIVLMRVNLAHFRDSFGDKVGYLLVAREVEDALSAAKKKRITDREQEIVRLVLAGNSNREIADALNITLKTVETHMTSVFNKLGLKNRMELAGYFLHENKPD